MCQGLATGFDEASVFGPVFGLAEANGAQESRVHTGLSPKFGHHSKQTAGLRSFCRGFGTLTFACQVGGGGCGDLGHPERRRHPVPLDRMKTSYEKSCQSKHISQPEDTGNLHHQAQEAALPHMEGALRTIKAPSPLVWLQIHGAAKRIF